MGKLIDETGKQYGRLTVIKEAGRSKHGFALWLCRCGCGKETTIIGASLRTGATSSCGCLRKDRVREVLALPPRQAAFNNVYNSYKNRARIRGFSYELTKEDVSFLTQMNCHYCGCIPAQEQRINSDMGSYIYNGIDRIDSNKGYTMNNVVPCCKKCNYMKRDMTTLEFKEQLLKILKHKGWI